MQLTTSQPNLSGNGSSASVPALSPEDIMDLLGQQRRHVLKRVPKASRISAAEKLAQTLLQVITVPTCVENWKNLLTFTYACFSVPGQLGGKRHLSSLASKVVLHWLAFRQHPSMFNLCRRKQSSGSRSITWRPEFPANLKMVMFEGRFVSRLATTQ